jgi:hypothetical protein
VGIFFLNLRLRLILNGLLNVWSLIIAVRRYIHSWGELRRLTSEVDWARLTDATWGNLGHLQAVVIRHGTLPVIFLCRSKLWLIGILILGLSYYWEADLPRHLTLDERISLLRLG